MKPEHVEYCPSCGSHNIHWWDGGDYGKGITHRTWNAYKCLDCGEIVSDEPDWELLYDE